jgi:hypothetical protein
LTLALILTARVVVVPGVADDALLAAARAAGQDVVPIDDTRAALALVDDPACRAGDARCLARLALIAEADAAVIVTAVDDIRVDAVVVTAAAERRRVQTVRRKLTEDVARALAPPASARLRLRGEARFTVDGTDVPGAPAAADDSGDVALDITVGEHRIVAAKDGHAPAVVILDVAAGESLMLAPSPTPLPPAPTTPAWWTTTAVGFGVAGLGGVVTGGMLVMAAVTAVQDAEAATFQNERIAARDAANGYTVGAVVASSLGAVAVATAVTMTFWGPP